MKIKFNKNSRVVFRGFLLTPDTNGECELPKALSNRIMLGKLLSRFKFLTLVTEGTESDIPSQPTEVESETQESPEIDTFVDGSESEPQELTEVTESEPEIESETQDSGEVPEVEPELESETQESAEDAVDSKD